MAQTDGLSSTTSPRQAAALSLTKINKERQFRLTRNPTNANTAVIHDQETNETEVAHSQAVDLLDNHIKIGEDLRRLIADWIVPQLVHTFISEKQQQHLTPHDLETETN